MTQLDQHLKNFPIQYIEHQGRESTDFNSYFKTGVVYKVTQHKPRCSASAITQEATPARTSALSWAEGQLAFYQLDCSVLLMFSTDFQMTFVQKCGSFLSTLTPMLFLLFNVANNFSLQLCFVYLLRFPFLIEQSNNNNKLWYRRHRFVLVTLLPISPLSLASSPGCQTFSQLSLFPEADVMQQKKNPPMWPSGKMSSCWFIVYPLLLKGRWSCIRLQSCFAQRDLWTEVDESQRPPHC